MKLFNKNIFKINLNHRYHKWITDVIANVVIQLDDFIDKCIKDPIVQN